MCIKSQMKLSTMKAMKCIKPWRWNSDWTSDSEWLNPPRTSRLSPKCYVEYLSNKSTQVRSLTRSKIHTGGSCQSS